VKKQKLGELFFKYKMEAISVHTK